ncbi:GCN5 family acetyltransferase [Brevibacillus parabrevis]|uniref:GNAT family N-acetyltransferase n=1 Tax=Brevibacillus parabrevis TaxID=54914 RepID=UPI0007AB762E|nr:GNAT family N-acetyltransferase [Brevibacillus parabrevis]KZE52876.1 GCN5 family acetyltransferase [Brevibacillus parabrevis]
MIVLETERLVLRRAHAEDDAAFVFGLLNEPSWLQYIGDRGVRTLADAQQYIVNSLQASYESYGFGLFVVAEKATGTPVGLCGLIKRDFLEDVDIGYALCPPYWGKGYAFEAASAVLDYGREAFGLKRIVAITDKANDASGKLLEKLGLRWEGYVRKQPDQEELKFFSIDFPS